MSRFGPRATTEVDKLVGRMDTEESRSQIHTYNLPSGIERAARSGQTEPNTLNPPAGHGWRSYRYVASMAEKHSYRSLPIGCLTHALCTCAGPSRGTHRPSQAAQAEGAGRRQTLPLVVVGKLRSISHVCHVLRRVVLGIGGDREAAHGGYRAGPRAAA